MPCARCMTLAMSAVKQYLTGMHRKFDHLATWLPNEKLAIGDIGILRDGRFYRRTTLLALRIRFEVRNSAGSADWDHTSGADLQVELSAGNESAGDTTGHAVINFGAAGAFLFQARGVETETIDNMAAVSAEILSAHRAHRFERDWMVMDRIVRAKSAVILLSESKKARVVLAAPAALASMAALGDSALGVEIAGTEGEVTRFLMRDEHTPLFGASRLRDSLFGGPRVEPVRSETGAHDANEALRLQAVSLADHVATLSEQ
jgi:hypothetical protein